MEPTDADLMQQLADGDDLALNALMNRWRERIAAFLFRMTGDRGVAIDLAQETFVRLYRMRQRYRPAGQFSSYLFTIAANLARNHARWVSRHPTVPLDHPSGDDSAQGLGDTLASMERTPQQTAIAVETVEAVERAFAALAPDLREAMSLFIHEGLSYAEIAKVTGSSVKAVEMRIYRARQFLRSRLER